MTTKKNFKFDEEKSYLRGTEKNGKFYATFNAIADDGTVELREFIWKSEGNKVLVKDKEGKLKVTSKDELLNQAARHLESLGPIGRTNVHLKTEFNQMRGNLSIAEDELREKDSELYGVAQSRENYKASTVVGGVLAATGLLAFAVTFGGNIAKDGQIATLEDTIDTQNDTINTKNTIISNLAGDLGEKNATIKWHQDAWNLDNKTIVSSGLYNAGWNDSIEARKNITRTYITDNFNNDEISAVTTENLNGLTIDQLFDVALELEHNEGDSEGYLRAVAMVGDVLAAEGLQESDYASAGLIERLVLYGEHVVAENKTAFFDDGYDEGYAIALQEAVSIADDIMGKAKANEYDKVDALVKAYGEAVAAEALQLADYNDKYVIDAVTSGNWSKADQALDRLANLRGGAPSIPDNETKFHDFMKIVTDSELNELDTTALSFGYSSFTDMWNQDFVFYAVDTFGPGAVIVAYDGDTRVAEKLSDPLYQKIKSQGE